MSETETGSEVEPAFMEGLELSRENLFGAVGHIGLEARGGVAVGKHRFRPSSGS